MKTLQILIGCFAVEALVTATEKITGTRDEPHTGILFTLPVTRAWELQRKQL